MRCVSRRAGAGGAPVELIEESRGLPVEHLAAKVEELVARWMGGERAVDAW